MPRASFIIPVYNAKQTLDRCVASVARQTHTDLDIWLIDDGSTDGSGPLCESWARREARVHVLHQDNRGVSAARNAGLERAAGDFLIFVDSDDWISPRLCETMLREQEESGADLVVCGYVGEYAGSGRQVRVPGERRRYGREAFLRDFGRLYQKTYLSGPCFKLYRAALIRAHELRFDEDVDLGEDLLFNLRYYAVCAGVSLIPDALYHYRQEPHGTSLTHRARADKLGQQAALYRQVARFCQEQGAPPRALRCAGSVLLRQFYAQLDAAAAAHTARGERLEALSRLTERFARLEGVEELEAENRWQGLVIALARRGGVRTLDALIRMKQTLRNPAGRRGRRLSQGGTPWERS